jgi:hypothetical protein
MTFTMEGLFDPQHKIHGTDAIPAVLEGSGKVVAVFSGHYHDGGYQVANGIPYIVLQDNPAYGNDVSYDNQYAVVDVYQEGRRHSPPTRAILSPGGDQCAGPAVNGGGRVFQGADNDFLSSMTKKVARGFDLGSHGALRKLPLRHVLLAFRKRQPGERSVISPSHG